MKQNMIYIIYIYTYSVYKSYIILYKFKSCWEYKKLKVWAAKSEKTKPVDSTQKGKSLRLHR